MAIAATGPISFSELQTEHTGSNPISISEYYKTPNGLVQSNNIQVPTSGPISMSNFYGSVNTVTVSLQFNELYANLDIAPLFGSSWSSATPKILIIPFGTQIVGTRFYKQSFPDRGALNVLNSPSMGGTLRIENYGSIVGSSGEGLYGELPQDRANGGHAYFVDQPNVSIINHTGSLVRPGGGGGGKGGSGGAGGIGGPSTQPHPGSALVDTGGSRGTGGAGGNGGDGVGYISQYTFVNPSSGTAGLSGSPGSSGQMVEYFTFSRSAGNQTTITLLAFPYYFTNDGEFYGLVSSSTLYGLSISPSPTAVQIVNGKSLQVEDSNDFDYNDQILNVDRGTFELIGSTYYYNSGTSNLTGGLGGRGGTGGAGSLYGQAGETGSQGDFGSSCELFVNGELVYFSAGQTGASGSAGGSGGKALRTTGGRLVNYYGDYLTSTGSVEGSQVSTTWPTGGFVQYSFVPTETPQYWPSIANYGAPYQTYVTMGSEAYLPLNLSLSGDPCSVNVTYYLSGVAVDSIMYYHDSDEPTPFEYGLYFSRGQQFSFSVTVFEDPILGYPPNCTLTVRRTVAPGSLQLIWSFISIPV